MASTISSILRSASDGRSMLHKIRKLFGESLDENDSDEVLANRQTFRQRSKSQYLVGIQLSNKVRMPKRVRFKGCPATFNKQRQNRSFSAPPPTSRPPRYRSCLTNHFTVDSILSHYHERNSKMESILANLRKGFYVMRYKWSKSPKRRHIRISDDHGELIWGRSPTRSLGSVHLAEVQAIVLGPRTEAFIDYDWIVGKPWLCFSIVTEARTLDFECSSNDEVRGIILGLQSCITLSYESLTYARLLWTRAILKCIRIARQSGLHTLDVFRHLEIHAKQLIRQQKIQALVVRYLSEPLRGSDRSESKEKGEAGAS